jgi:phosphate transport system substrate-binding protein
MLGFNLRILTSTVALLVAGAASVAVADPITLKSADGTLNVTGELLKFEGGVYSLRTDLGDLKITASRVTCEGISCPETGMATADLRFGGADEIGDGLMPLLTKGFATFMDADAGVENADGPTVKHGLFLANFTEDEGFGDSIGGFVVTPTVSSDAFTKLLNGNIDIGMSSRRITPDEARALKAKGAGTMVAPSQERIIAADAVVIIVNPGNPINSISIGDLGRIYSGQITDWSQLGGPELPIKVIAFAEGAGNLSIFNDRIYGGNPPPQAPAIVVKSNQFAADTVNSLPGAIAYVSQAFTRGAKALPIVNECGISALPDVFSVKTGEYAIQRLLYLYTTAELDNELATRFLDYTTSEGASQVIVQSGFVDFGVAMRDQGADSARAAELATAGSDDFEKKIVATMVENMTGTSRLSTTFRFKPGSTTLDRSGFLDLQRLVKALSAMPSGTKVRLVGFSDADGEFEPNISVSKSRADIVARALLAEGGDKLGNVTIETLGYGEIAPVACNNTSFGREINRRVEVWVSQG